MTFLPIDQNFVPRAASSVGKREKRDPMTESQKKRLRDGASKIGIHLLGGEEKGLARDPSILVPGDTKRSHETDWWTF